MDTNKSRDHDSAASNYLDSVVDGYIFDEVSGIYKPKTESAQNNTQEQNVGADKKRPLWVSVVRDWPVFLVSVGTLVLLVATVHYARKQWFEANRSAKASIESAYTSCLSAQAAQKSLIQIENGAIDSHSVAVATVEQADAGTDSQRAFITFNAAFPNPSQSGNRFSIPYSFKNEGKSAAYNLYLWIHPVVLSDKQTLKFTEKSLYEDAMQFQFLKANDGFPPNDPSVRGLDYSVQVKDGYGKDVASTSPIALNILNAVQGETIYVYGNYVYTDFSGTYNIQFCEPLGKTKVGEAHAPSKNEYVCYKHNSPHNTYFKTPEPAPIKTLATAVAPILCVEPK